MIRAAAVKVVKNRCGKELVREVIRSATVEAT